LAYTNKDNQSASSNLIQYVLLYLEILGFIYRHVAKFQTYMSQQNSKNELECFEEARIEFEKYAQSANLINFNQSPFYAGLISELAIAYKNNNNMKMAKDLANQSLKLRDRIFAK